MNSQREVFLRQARDCDGRSPLYARLCRELAEEPLVLTIEQEPRWDLPLRLLGGLHYLELSEGADVWADVRSVLSERREWLASFVAEQPVQTNEVQRAWGFLPAFLLLARDVGRPLDLLELGPSGGLNLVWDRYRYRYGERTWGPPDSGLELSGELIRAFPLELLSFEPVIRQRRGVDLEPLDVTTEDGTRLLECFIWADQAERLARLRTAIELLRRDPPELIRGDYVELVPELLAERDESAFTVVFETASVGFLPDERREQLLADIVRAGEEGPLGLLMCGFDPETEDTWPLELTVWPGGERRRLAFQDFHGVSLEWLL